MAQLDFRSPGLSTRELDISGPTAAQPTGIPAGIVSATQLGPAFVPITVPSITDHRTIFGVPVTNIKFGPLAATEWLKTQQALTHLRVLGVGDGTQRTTSGVNKGRVNNAGFVVGSQQPQALLSGALSNNTYANATSTVPTANGPTGRTYFLGCFMSQSVNSTMFTDAGYTLQSTPVVRGVIFAASGVLLQLSNSFTNSSPPNTTQAADFSAGTIRGSSTGSLKLSGSLQEFVLLLNGKTYDAQYPNFLTCSFDPNAPNYFGAVLNRDPLKIENAGLYLYSHWDIFPSVAVPTGSGAIIVASGANGAGAGYENIAFIVTGALARNSGSTTAPNFENFEDRYRTASTPWITSQKFGGKAENLFKVWAISDGEAANTRAKISIENITPANSTAQVQYGTFDIIVRDFNDTDGNKVILEQWRGMTLDSSSPKYIGRIIGDMYTFFNWDANTDSQKLTTLGDFPVRSRYIRVELSDGVKNASLPPTALPIGFRGPRHLVTSGSAPLQSFSDNNYYTMSSIFGNVVEPPVPYRLTLSKGSSPNLTSDRTLYWGVQFEQVTSALEPNASTAPNRSMYAQTRYFPNFHTDFMNVAVDNTVGTADSSQNGIIDNDRFNNNFFSLEKIRVVYNTNTSLADINQLPSWAYVRSGNIATNTTALTRGLTLTDLTDPSVRSVTKFTVHMAGGFDGTRIFNKETAFLSNKAVLEEVTNASRGYSNGPTIIAYQKAVDIMKDVLEIDIQLMAIPGIRHRIITDYAIAAIESDRFDCFNIFDLEEKDGSNNDIVDTTQIVSVKNTVTNFRNRGIDSSYSGTYFPDVIIQDEYNRTVERVPPSVAVLGAFGKNDAIGHPWTAPAGFNRASLTSVRNASLPLSRDNMGDLYSERINPIAEFQGQQAVVWGQKTVKATTGSSLERINVRRMMLAIRRQVKKVSNRIMFEPARDETLSKFQKLVDPILKSVQDQGGIDKYSVRIDTSTTTQADLENKTIRGKIFLNPTKTLEFMSIDFAVTNRATFISG